MLIPILMPMGRMMINGDTMSWEGELRKKMSKTAQVARFIKRNLPKWKVVEILPDRVHGGIVRYTEANPSERHDPRNEPHQISLPSSPAVKWKAWLRGQLADALEQNAKSVGVDGQMRGRFRNQGGYKLASENKEERNWFNLLKAPRPFRDDPKAKRTKGNIPYMTYDELSDVEREQADRGLEAQADKDARARMKDPSLQSRIEMEMRRKGKRAGKKEARTRLTEEARADLQGKRDKRAFMGRGREPGLYGRSVGYDIDTDEGVATYESGYTGAERYHRFKPVKLTRQLKRVLAEKKKKEDIEPEFRRIIDDYMRNGGKFEREHITLLNKAGLGGSVMMDIVRDNLARR